MKSEAGYKFEERNEIHGKPDKLNDSLGALIVEPIPEQIMGPGRAVISSEIDQDMAKLQVEQKKGMLKKLAGLIRDKIVDISPDFLISADKLIADFESKMRQSISLSENGGKFFNYLAQHAIYKPNKKYSHTPKETSLPGATEREINYLEFLKNYSGRKSRVVRDVKKEVSKISEESAPDFYEEQGDGFLYQRFQQNIAQDSKENVVEELVSNQLWAGGNKASTDLYIHNLTTGKVLDVGQLLPEGYSLGPASMLVIDDKREKVDGRYKERYVINPKNLRNYSGTQNESGGFSMSPRFKSVQYGDLTKKGAMLTLLHEIAHVWQTAHHEEYGMAIYKSFFENMMKGLKLLESSVEVLRTTADEKLIENIKHNITTIIKGLKDIGIEVDPETFLDNQNQTLKQGQYKVTQMGQKYSSDANKPVNHVFSFVIKADKLKPLIEDYVCQERDAWAHAIRVLRFFEKQGFELEPELKTLNDIQRFIHYRLGTYQADLESDIKTTKGVRQFTRKN